MASTTLSTSAMVAMMIPNTTPRADQDEGADHAVLDGVDHVLDGVGHLGGPVGLRQRAGARATYARGGRDALVAWSSMVGEISRRPRRPAACG